jgi:hypothetical protein
VWFRTVSHPDLSELYARFYHGGRKIIPLDVVRAIEDPFIMAIWFMDDGNAKTHHGQVNGYHLNTQSFSKQENELLVEMIEAVHGIHFCVERNHEYYRLGVYAQNSRSAFIKLISPHILPTMKYKLAA